MASTKPSQGKYLKGTKQGQKLGKGKNGMGPLATETGVGPKVVGGMGRRDGARVHGKPTHKG